MEKKWGKTVKKQTEKEIKKNKKSKQNEVAKTSLTRRKRACALCVTSDDQQWSRDLHAPRKVHADMWGPCLQSFRKDRKKLVLGNPSKLELIFQSERQINNYA